MVYEPAFTHLSRNDYFPQPTHLRESPVLNPHSTTVMKNTSGRPPVTAEQLHETFAPLHARNIDSDEALKLERNQAVAAKHVVNTRKAVINAKPRSKSETSTSVKETRRPDHSDADRDRPLQNLPTSRTAISLRDAVSELPFATENEIQGRWQTSLLAGGTQGSVSLSQKEQRVHNAAATALERLKSYNHEADSMYHRTLEAHRLRDALDLAFMRIEAEADAADYGALDMVYPDVIEDYPLEDGA